VGRLFGTDGVRGKAGEFLDAITALKLAQSVGVYFKQSSANIKRKVLLGKDTRRSGYMIENALVAGFTSVGYDVIQIGPMPTPAIAYLTESMRCDAGIMLSASHNSYEDNGVKFFNSHGDKLDEKIEEQIEEIFFNDKLLQTSQVTDAFIGKAKRIDDVIGRYIVSIKYSFPIGINLTGLRIVLDCANGASYKVAPTIFDELGADLIVLHDKPNGMNINDECGALHPKNLGENVKKYRADIGIAFDGDADRVVIVDEKGDVVDGDKLIGALAVYLKSENLLTLNSCVATVMSNIALENYLKNNGIKLYRSDVGDKYVLEVMKDKNIKLGGEQSGHIIFSDISKTGDGIASSLQALAMLIKSGKKASEVFNPFKLAPQILKNIQVEEKIPLEKINGLEDLLSSFRQKGLRDLIRYSGTENKIRLLLEGEDIQEVKKCMEQLTDFIKSKLC
jgi:phosphoglucosamine mutase